MCSPAVGLVVLALALSLLPAGCGGGAGGPDAAPGPGSDVRPDVALPDSGGRDGDPGDAPDAAPAPDLGRPDGAYRDDGPGGSEVRDAGPSDAGDAGPPPCRADEECRPLAPDLCTLATCVDGACAFAPRDCPPMAAADCVIGHCEPETGACRDVQVPDGTACEDGLFCTVNDACVAGVCVAGSPRECHVDDPLLTTWCDEERDACEAVTDGCDNSGCTSGADCDDGDPCTTDSCATFLTPACCLRAPRPACACLPEAPDGGAADCDDGNPETSDACVPNSDPQVPYAGLCTHEYRDCWSPCDDPAPCDDGDKCTVDLCETGTGESTGCCLNARLLPPCGLPCQTDADCPDGDRFTPDRCGDDGTCDPPGPAVHPCRDEYCTEDDDPCTTARCVEETGLCGFVFNASACDDGDACTVNDACEAGVCRGEPRSCDDFDGCSEDGCDPQTGCVHLRAADAPDGCGPDCRLDPAALCDDLDVCTEDVCDSGLCRHRELDDDDDTPRCRRFPCRDVADCDDGNPCTADECRPAPPDTDGPGGSIPRGGCLYGEAATCAIQAPGSADPLACAAAADCDPADCRPDSDAALCRRATVDCPTAWCDAEVGCRFLPTAACLPLE